jgi:hypothetical protein
LQIAFKKWWEASYGRPPGTHAVMTHVAFAAYLLNLTNDAYAEQMQSLLESIYDHFVNKNAELD